MLCLLLKSFGPIRCNIQQKTDNQYFINTRPVFSVIYTGQTQHVTGGTFLVSPKDFIYLQNPGCRHQAS